MLRRVIALAFATALLLPAALVAQEEGYERGDLAQVVTWRIQPDQAGEFEAAVAKVVEAANLAGLSGYRWSFWSDAFDYTLVFPIAGYAYFEDPDQWMRPMMGTPGEAALTEGMGAFAAINFETVSNMIAEEVADWTRMPEGVEMSEMMFAHVDEIWLKGDQEEAFDALVPEWYAMLDDAGFPYPTIGHKTRIGDERLVFVVLYDSKANFYGVNSLDALVAAKDMGERYQDLIGQFTTMITRLEHVDVAYRPELSYWPEEEGMASN